MDIKAYLKEYGREEGQRLARSSGTTLAYLDQIAWGNRKPGIKLMRRLIKKSKGILTRERLRPDVYYEERAS